MNNNPSIEQTVMRRVRFAHAVRPLMTNAVLALVLFALALWGIGREVWVAQVFANAPHHFMPAARFFLAALLNTRLAVQVLVAVALVSLIAAARAIAVSLSRMPVLIRA